MLKSFDKEGMTAVLICDEEKEPNVVGLKLAYVSPYWQAFHIWMVLAPMWGWQRSQFHGADAIAEDYEAKESCVVGGRDVRVWTKLEPVGLNNGESRHYPATDQSLPVRSEIRVIRGAWGHEHCQLCNQHIDAGMFGYCDPSGYWMCESCYDRYIARHHLSFVDEL